MRLTRIEGLDLSLFEFDLDLTLAMFFLNDRDQVYARYCGRDGEDADNRQSLAGLRATMKSVLQMHRADKKVFAPRRSETPKFAGRSPFGKGGGCIHCHQAKERDFAERMWSRDLVYRFPLPDNLGFVLDVDLSNVIKSVKPNSPAAALGLKKGDVVRLLGGVPIHSFADAQYALDGAPKKGTVSITWEREGQSHTGELALAEGWRVTDLHWRRSVGRWLATLPLDGPDLTAQEKKDLGLSEKQLAFRLGERVRTQAANAGFRPGDIILGIEGQHLEMSCTQFYFHVQRQHLIGDTITISLLRDGARLKLQLPLK